MHKQRLRGRSLKAAASCPLGAAALLAAVLISSNAVAGATPPPEHLPKGDRPCNIYAAAGTPCVGAYSTVRALYRGYKGLLYQVERASDGQTLNIRAAHADGIADAAAQNAFCAHTSCTITKLFDQSPQHNNLTIEREGTQGGPDAGAPAAALPVRLGGHKVYGIKISPGMGYRDDATTGVAVNGQPESMYMVTSGDYVNDRCCFDFGNAETNNKDNGNGHMDALYFGTARGRYPPEQGSGPWVEADMENGLFRSGAAKSVAKSNMSIAAPFVTAMLKNNGQNFFALKYGNAQSGKLDTSYAGPLPTDRSGYSPLRQEGAIVLGTGGDNSNRAKGEFFEGAITKGTPPKWADNAVQADIVSARYDAANATR